MGRFERELDESIARYEARRRKAEQLYEEERTAAQLGEELEPQEETTRGFSVGSLVVGIMLLLAATLAFSSFGPSFIQSMDEIADDGNMTGTTLAFLKVIPMAALAIPVLMAIGFVRNRVPSVFDDEEDPDGCEGEEVEEEEEEGEFIVKGKVIRRTSQ